MPSAFHPHAQRNAFHHRDVRADGKAKRVCDVPVRNGAQAYENPRKNSSSNYKSVAIPRARETYSMAAIFAAP
jgi:hypothetical protein